MDLQNISQDREGFRLPSSHDADSPSVTPSSVNDKHDGLPSEPLKSDTQAMLLDRPIQLLASWSEETGSMVPVGTNFCNLFSDESFHHAIAVGPPDGAARHERDAETSRDTEASSDCSGRVFVEPNHPHAQQLRYPSPGLGYGDDKHVSASEDEVV